MTRLDTSAGMGQQWSNRAQYARAAISADQTEWQAVLHGSAHVMVGTLDEEMSEEADQDLQDGIRIEDPIEGKSRVLELTQGLASELITKRVDQLGDAYPFDRVDNSLHYKAQTDKLPIYELLLGISRAPSLTRGDFVQLPRLFEQLSRLAGMAFLGPSAKGFHTGWPRPETPTRFKHTIEQLRADSGSHFSEWAWQPDGMLPNDPVPALIKDGGLDIVAWRPWDDRRGGQLYLLGQCACGLDWPDKTADLNLTRLSDWFRPPRVSPLRSLFTPHYAISELLFEHSPQAGLMFDRARMVHLLREPYIQTELVALTDQIKTVFAIAKQENPTQQRRQTVHRHQAH